MATRKARRIRVYKKGYGSGYRAGYRQAKRAKAERKALSMYRRLVRPLRIRHYGPRIGVRWRR